MEMYKDEDLAPGAIQEPKAPAATGAIEGGKDIKPAPESVAIAQNIGNTGYFHTFGLALLGNGYLIVPITPGHKRPPMEGWQKARFGQSDLTKFTKHGVGVLCGQGTHPIVAIDIDTTNKVLAEQFVAWCEEHLGATCERVGNAPKILLPYRAAQAGWDKASSQPFSTEWVQGQHGRWYSEGYKEIERRGKRALVSTGQIHKVEVLGHGQQFVAYHIHPDTGLPYEWIDLFGGLEHMRADDLPVITEDQVEEALQVFNEMARTVGLQAHPVSAAKGPSAPKEHTPAAEDDFFGRVNEAALSGLHAWVPLLFPTAREYHGGFRVASVDLGRDLEEDLSIVPDGIVDFGVADMGDPREGKRTPIDLVLEWAPRTFDDPLDAPSTPLDAALWLCERLETPKEALGFGLRRQCETAAERIDRTDAGNVALLASLVDGNLRFVPEHKMWLWWSGERWERDQYGTFSQAAALQVAEHYHRKAQEIRKQAQAAALDDKERKNIEKAASSMEAWASRCRGKSGIDNMLSLAKSDDRFTLPADKLDRDPWLLGVDNGVVNLRTGLLGEASRDEFVTKRSPIRFTPGAAAPRWLQFIEEITAEPTPGAAEMYRSRPALASYLQRALGYALTGSTGEHKMFIAIGEGSNGKNVLLDMLQWIAGAYCETIAPEALMASKKDADAERATPSARKLAGARVAISSESKDGQRLDVALVKRHTGGGYMTARGLHENTFTFEITHKLWLMTNHRPALDHMDEAMRGRLHLIPFDMRWNRPGHPERDPRLPDGDKALPEKLRAEAEGVLAWLVAGAVGYVRDGLEPPREVARMTRAYFKDQDPLGLWLDNCEVCDPKHGARASDLFNAFREWCHEEGFNDAEAESQTAFSKKLKARGIEGHKTKDGKRYGLRASGDAEFV